MTAVSVPRDDYVDLAGCPASQCRGKVKHAYSLAYRRVMDEAGADTADSAATHDTGQEQKAREAGHGLGKVAFHQFSSSVTGR